jgi:predicted transcriptional regulator
MKNILCNRWLRKLSGYEYYFVWKSTKNNNNLNNDIINSILPMVRNTAIKSINDLLLYKIFVKHNNKFVNNGFYKISEQNSIYIDNIMKCLNEKFITQTDAIVYLCLLLCKENNITPTLSDLKFMLNMNKNNISKHIHCLYNKQIINIVKEKGFYGQWCNIYQLNQI